MLNHWLLLSDGAAPTEDIYFFRPAAADLKVQRVQTGFWRSPTIARMLGRLGPQSDTALLICRTLPAPWIDWVAAHRSRFRRVVYLIDDDLPAAAADNQLPAAYRQRMGAAAAHQPRLLAIADEVVASSPGLARQFADRHPRVRVLTPPLIQPLPSLTHFHERSWTIGFHGTRAHLPDLQHITPALTGLHDADPDVHIEVMLGRHTPADLVARPRVQSLPPKPWPDFLRWQREHRIHIGVVPLLDTPFNRGKSFIKFHDIAVLGGVGVYSRRPPYTEIVRHGENGLLAGDDPAEWQACIEGLLSDPEAAQAMAAQAAADARRVGDFGPAMDLWKERETQA